MRIEEAGFSLGDDDDDDDDDDEGAARGERGGGEIMLAKIGKTLALYKVGIGWEKR